MRVPRSQITTALFTLLKNSYPFQTASPRMQVPDDLPASAQPALFLVKPKESPSQEQVQGLPSYRIQYFVLILMRANETPEDEGSTAEQVMDAILDAVEAALMPIPGELQTLGNLVTHCWISGEIQIDPPVLFSQSAAWIPVTVLVGV